MNKKILLSIIFIITIYSPLSADRMKLAVLDLKPIKGTSKSIAERASEWLRTEMITKNFSVIKESSMRQILKKHSFPISNCTDISCAVKAGKLLSARKVLLGTVKKLNKKIILSGTMIDVRNKKIEFKHKETIKSIRNLDEGVRLFAQNINSKAQNFIKVKPAEKKLDKPEKSKQPLGQHNSFAGRWNTTYGPLIITQSGSNLTGSYYNGKASLKGTMIGKRLDYIWRESTGSGNGSFVLSNNGNSFSGFWTAGSSTKMPWNGSRIK